MKKLIRIFLRERKIKKCEKRIKKLLSTINWWGNNCTCFYSVKELEYEILVLKLQLHHLKRENVTLEDVYDLIEFLSEFDRLNSNL